MFTRCWFACSVCFALSRPPPEVSPSLSLPPAAYGMARNPPRKLVPKSVRPLAGVAESLGKAVNLFRAINQTTNTVATQRIYDRMIITQDMVLELFRAQRRVADAVSAQKAAARKADNAARAKARREFRQNNAIKAKGKAKAKAKSIADRPALIPLMYT